VLAARHEARLGAPARDVVVQVQADRVRAPAGESPVVEVDAQFRQPRH